MIADLMIHAPPRQKGLPRAPPPKLSRNQNPQPTSAAERTRWGAQHRGWCAAAQDSPHTCRPPVKMNSSDLTPQKAKKASATRKWRGKTFIRRTVNFNFADTWQLHNEPCVAEPAWKRHPFHVKACRFIQQSQIKAHPCKSRWLAACSLDLPTPPTAPTPPGLHIICAVQRCMLPMWPCPSPSRYPSRNVKTKIKK